MVRNVGRSGTIRLTYNRFLILDFMVNPNSNMGFQLGIGLSHSYFNQTFVTFNADLMHKKSFYNRLQSKLILVEKNTLKSCFLAWANNKLAHGLTYYWPMGFVIF